jgi:hypothetical protein
LGANLPTAKRFFIQITEGLLAHMISRMVQLMTESLLQGEGDAFKHKKMLGQSPVPKIFSSLRELRRYLGRRLILFAFSF